ncbi:MAG: 2-oxoacid:acceptor oxidoreductase family protein [Candidatus Heimdallarchaeota archaeon]|nr:2-oxoacid:acceptor oxidoreductase family protein [Candidatus Heimdallarchaeota archaeon]
MDKLIRIKIGGIGGQGVQFFSKLMIEATFLQGLNVTATSWYEPASTGGLTVADIILAPKDQEIVFPFIEQPDILICLAQRAYDEFKDMVTKKTVVLIDSMNVQNFEGSEWNNAKLALNLPLYETAIKLGNEKLGNIVALGFISEMLDFDDHFIPAIIQDVRPEDAENLELLEVDAKYFEQSLIKSSPEKFREKNVQALRDGYQLSRDTDYKKLVYKN